MSSSPSAGRERKRRRASNQQGFPAEEEVKEPASQEPRPWFVHFTGNDPVYREYMAKEWGYEKSTNEALFEKLSLEGAQSGLSWKTILNKREAYRETFHHFDIAKVAGMTSNEVDRILSSTESGPRVVVRHRGKVNSVVNNAKMILQMEKEEGVSFADFLWSFVDGKPILNRWKTIKDVPSKTVESTRMSDELRKRGFKFVGPTTCYSMMQSCGFVIDHPSGSPEWNAAKERLEERDGGYQER